MNIFAETCLLNSRSYYSFGAGLSYFLLLLKSRALTLRIISFLVLLAIAGRAGGEFFHTHAESQTAGYSAPCNACNLEATALHCGGDAPALPAVAFELIRLQAPQPSKIVVSFVAKSSGRSPPQA